MKAFLDTSVLVAAFYTDHEHHEPSFELFLKFGKEQACCAAHSLAEVYSCLTGMPGKARASGDEAMLFLTNIREHLTVVSLNEREYFQVLEASSAVRVISGGIYDVLLGHCALKAKAETIYTWNTKHFKHLGPSIADLVRAP